MFTAANVLAALAPAYPVLLVLRVLAASAAAAATPVLFSTAASLAPPERVGRYVAVVVFGVTGTIAVGVPVGTWIGGAFGWRATFALMAVAGVAFGAAVLLVLPCGTGVREALPVRRQLAILARPAVSLGLAANLVLMLGSMMVLTYLAPYVGALADAGPGERGVLFAVSGVAGMLGIWAGGAATNRWGPDRTLVAGVAAFVVSMAALLTLWPWRPVSLGMLLPVVVWGGAAFWNSPAVQARLHLLAVRSPPRRSRSTRRARISASRRVGACSASMAWPSFPWWRRWRRWGCSSWRGNPSSERQPLVDKR